jgi:ATP-binding cassette, subfamily F, member 3
VMVSHDRHLLSTVTDRFLLVDGGEVRDFDGDLDDYARWLARGTAAPAPAAAAAAKPPEAAPRESAARGSAQQRRRDGAEQRKALAPLRARLARCDKRLLELSARAGELDALLADPQLYGADARARQLDLTTQRARVAQEVEQVEGEWLEISEELERAQSLQ